MSVCACICQHSKGVFLVHGSEPCVHDFKTHMVCEFQHALKLLTQELVIFYFMLFSYITLLYHISHLEEVNSNYCLCQHSTVCVRVCVCLCWSQRVHLKVHVLSELVRLSSTAYILVICQFEAETVHILHTQFNRQQVKMTIHHTGG